MPQQPSPFINKMYKFFPMAEGVFLTALAVGLVLQWMDYKTSIIFISLLGLAVIYFLSAFEVNPSDDSEGKGFLKLITNRIAPKILGIGSSVAAIGVLFYLNQMNGYKEQVFIGGLSTVWVFLITAIAAMVNGQSRKDLLPRLLRATPILLICLYMWINLMMNEGI